MAKILVVDDEPNVLRAFEDILTNRGHEAVCVGGAEEALRRLKDADVDLVILDVCLPGMGGLDALAQIRQIQPTLPVIVMTGQGTTDTAIEATKRGAFDYVEKNMPGVDVYELLCLKVQQAVERRRSAVDTVRRLEAFTKNRNLL